MIIPLTQKHPSAIALSGLAAVIRAQRRNAETAAPYELLKAVNLTETSHGNGTTTYLLLQGSASSEEAIIAYQFLRRFYPDVLRLYYHATARFQTALTIEVGTLSRTTEITYSDHELVQIIPRTLAMFRGTAHHETQ